MSDLKNISENGAPILHGEALKRIREDVAKRFAEALGQGATTLVPPKPSEERSLLAPTSLAPARPLRPLHEIATPILKVATRQAGSTPVRHIRHQETFEIVRPTESLEELFKESIAVLADLPQQATRQQRHEMGEDVWGDGD